MEGKKTFKVMSPGMLTTVQDRGRFGYGRYGVAPSGALDSLALRVANLLVDNLEDEACLEITMTGLELGALTGVTIAITGADLTPRINGTAIQMWRSRRLKPGDLLSCKTVAYGCRAYLAIGGGIDLPSVMGSKSTNLGSGFGGLEGRPLIAGDVLHGQSPELHLKAAGRHFDLNHTPAYANDWRLRVLLGPQDDQFSQTGLELFLQSVYTVSPQSDRTGIRLQGPALETKEGVPESIISEGVIPGAIQVPGDGQPIIILGETISGGYRKIATVISADMHLPGQMVPGDRVQFQAVSLWEARNALWRLEEKITRFRNKLTG